MKVHSVVLYKNQAAFVTAAPSAGKFTVRFRTAEATATKPASYAEQSVREKDVLLLAEDASSLEQVLARAAEAPSADDMYDTESGNPYALAVREAWELLSSDEPAAGEGVPFAELWALVRPQVLADEAFLVYGTLLNTVYFRQDSRVQADGEIRYVPRSQEEIDALVRKASEKGREAEMYAAFLERLRQHSLLAEDSRFMGDVEALALGQTDRSRAMHDAHIKETPERAHRLLLDTGVWDITRNPYPARWGLSLQSAQESLGPAPDEERLEVPGESYAIDSPWSADPDDAVGFDGTYLWVHIADPAASVLPDSSIDRAARARGATLYIPERTSRMLSESSLSDYALGLSEKSRALSFRLLLADDGSIADCAVLKTLVRVRRLTYGQADTMTGSPELGPLFAIAERNVGRRRKSGAVQIDLPEVHITVDPETKRVGIQPESRLKSQELVREMMLLAGEGAARFAFQNNIPFPFVSQESPDIPDSVPEGLAGQFRLRKCMRKRSVGVAPAMHAGLGIAMYSQVTSPLRRYGDLVAHQQLRAFLDGRKPLDRDTVLERISAGDAASAAAHKAERMSEQHWTLVYLLQNPGWEGDAVCVDKGGRQPQFCIPSLAMETFLAPKSAVTLNQSIRVKVQAVSLSELSVSFVEA